MSKAATAPAEATPAAAVRGEDCAAVDCCAEKLKRDLKLKSSNNLVLRRQNQQSKDAAVQNGTVSLENGGHEQDEDEEVIGEPMKKSASQCNGGDGDEDSDKNRSTSLLGTRVVELHQVLVYSGFETCENCCQCWEIRNFS